MTPLTDADRRAYQANIWKSYLFLFLLNFQLWWGIWVLYLQDMRGFSLTQITLLEALFWGTAILAEVPTGAIADRFGRKASLALGAGFVTVAVITFGLASNYWIVLASYLTWAFGAAFLSGAEYALIFESLKAVGKESDFQRVAGRFGAIFSFAALAGGVAGAPIAAATDLSVPILLSAAIAAPAVLVALSMREPDLPEGEVRLAYGPLLRESARTAFGAPAVRTMLILSALVTSLTIAPHIFMQPFLAGHDVDTALLGVIQTPVRLAQMIGALFAFWLVARAGTRGVFISAPLLMVATYLALGSFDSVFVFAAFPLASFVNAVLLPPATDYLNQRIPNNQRATVLSIRMMVVSLSAAALEPALGVVADGVSLRAVFFVTAGVVAAVLPLALLLWLRADAGEREPP